MKKLTIILIAILILLTGCSSNESNLKTSSSNLAQAENQVATLKREIDRENNVIYKLNNELGLKQKDNEKFINELKLAKQSNSRKNEDALYVSTDDLLFWLVVRFDHSWIKYINNDDKEIFNYMVKDSDLYNLTVKFKKDHSRTSEDITSISLYDEVIKNDSAKLYVEEVVNEYKDNKIQSLTYNWVYSAKKINGIWYLDKMQREK